MGGRGQSQSPNDRVSTHPGVHPPMSESVTLDIATSSEGDGLTARVGIPATELQSGNGDGDGRGDTNGSRMIVKQRQAELATKVSCAGEPSQLHTRRATMTCCW